MQYVILQGLETMILGLKAQALRVVLQDLETMAFRVPRTSSQGGFLSLRMKTKEAIRDCRTPVLCL
jgi:hypothetical protein